MKATVSDLGRLDILVHNAAWQNRKDVEGLPEGRARQHDEGERLRLPAARAGRGAPPQARVLDPRHRIDRRALGSKRLSDYGGTKGAIHAITKCLAEELNDKQIRVNCVAPGPVWTPLNASDYWHHARAGGHLRAEEQGKSQMQHQPPEELRPRTSSSRPTPIRATSTASCSSHWRTGVIPPPALTEAIRMRPVWKGHITFGLVNVPVTLYPAEQRSDLHSHLVDSRNRARVRYERVNADTGEEVPWDSIVKGYEYSDGNFVLLSEDELKRAAGGATKAVEIASFVDLADIDLVYFETPYYLRPRPKGEGYVLLRRCSARDG